MYVFLMMTRLLSYLNVKELCLKRTNKGQDYRLSGLFVKSNLKLSHTITSCIGAIALGRRGKTDLCRRPEGYLTCVR